MQLLASQCCKNKDESCCWPCGLYAGSESSPHPQPASQTQRLQIHLQLRKCGAFALEILHCLPPYSALYADRQQKVPQNRCILLCQVMSCSQLRRRQTVYVVLAHARTLLSKDLEKKDERITSSHASRSNGTSNGPSLPKPCITAYINSGAS